MMVTNVAAVAAADYRLAARRLREQAQDKRRAVLGAQRGNRPLQVRMLEQDAKALEDLAILAENAATMELIDPRPADLE